MSKKKETIVEFKNVSKTYNKGKKSETKAVQNINLKVEKGDFLAILGRSGSGKSTMMNIIGLLDHKYQGTYKFIEKNAKKYKSNVKADLRGTEIGFIFQQFNLLKRSTVLENVLLPTTYNRSKDDLDRALKLLDRLGLSDKTESKTNELSGGQIQRVAIARSLMLQPSLLLADEPTGNLDSKTATQVMELLKELNEQGQTIILITHEEELAQYAKTNITLVDGKISK